MIIACWIIGRSGGRIWQSGTVSWRRMWVRGDGPRGRWIGSWRRWMFAFGCHTCTGRFGGCWRARGGRKVQDGIIWGMRKADMAGFCLAPRGGLKYVIDCLRSISPFFTCSRCEQRFIIGSLHAGGARPRCRCGLARRPTSTPSCQKIHQQLPNRRHVCLQGR